MNKGKKEKKNSHNKRLNFLYATTESGSAKFMLFRGDSQWSEHGASLNHLENLIYVSFT